MKYNHNVIRSKYQLVPRTLVFIRKSDRYLLIHKKKADSFGYKKLNGIGGHIENGEEPFESAAREVKEETGLDAGDLLLAAIIFIDIGTNPGILMFVFSANYISGDLVESDEGHLVWMEKEEIQKHQNVVKDVPYLIDITESHRSGDSPKIIKYLYTENHELRIVD